METEKQTLIDSKIEQKEDLQLNWLAEPGFWAQISEDTTDRTPLVIVLPSGRSSVSTSGHLALISDALYTHEIVSRINMLSIEGGKQGIDVKTMLDIDFYDLLVEHQQLNNSRTADGEFLSNGSSYNGFEELKANLLIIAGTNINIVAQELLCHCQADRIYGVGYTQDHTKNSLMGGNGKCYTITAHQHVGILAAFWQPWSGSFNRIAIHCGGLLAPGTASSNLMLLKYLNGVVYGNNKYREDVPVKIFSTPLKSYQHSELIDPSDCLPQHDMRGILEEIHIHE